MTNLHLLMELLLNQKCINIKISNLQQFFYMKLIKSLLQGKQRPFIIYIRFKICLLWQHMKLIVKHEFQILQISQLKNIHLLLDLILMKLSNSIVQQNNN
ncbi:unnamed protein product [Paramecium primaurelia]|uniref:Uncharacterized protein n=1 Tax=Paramecium primaurelia TaxID=5886 RepID=A0A8S1M460_PARPR|nr:unnamed protein product [Paramecium primaurelia]